MQIFELILSFVIGVCLAGLLGWIFALKTKGLLRLLLNSLAGVLILICCSLFRIIYLPLNPLNALLVGFLGVPGIAVIVVITMFL